MHRAPPGRLAAALAGALATLAAGCQGELPVPDDLQLSCTGGDCPSGWTCVAALDRCVKNDQLDTVAPALAATPGLVPSALRSSATLTLAFDATKDLRSPPVVVLHAGVDRAMTLDTGRSSDRHWVFTYHPAGDEPQRVACPVTIDLEDRQGLVASGLSGGTVQFDFVAPTLSNLVLTGSPARTGGLVRLGFTSSEPLAADPVVHLGTARTLLKAPASSGQDYLYEYTSDGSEPQDPAGLALTVDADDAAGNAAGGVAAGAAVFDRTAPSLVAPPVVTPLAARAGALVQVSFTATESLGADPVVRLGGLSLDKGSQVGRSYTYGHVANPPDAEGSAALTISMVDVAGNPTGALAGPNVVLDFTPPAVSAYLICADDGSPAPCAADQLLFGAQAGHDRLKVSFALSEPPGQVRVLAAPDSAGVTPPLPCASADGLSYTCTTLVSDPQAGAAPRVDTARVTVAAFDPAGNGVFAYRFATWDFQPPVLAGVPYLERCDGYTPARLAPNDLWTKPVAAYGGLGCPFVGTPTGPVRVHFSVSEPVTLGAGGVALDDGTPLTVDTSASTSTQLVAVLTADAAEGARQLTARVLDGAGNASALALGTLRVDRTPPAAPDTLTAGRILLHRIPWGTQATGGVAAPFLEGAAGAVAPSASVAVYTVPDASQASPVGRIQSDPTGAFGGPPGTAGAFPLSCGDLAEIYLLQEDAAGNQSPLALAWDSDWTATTGFKQPGSTSLNPHLFTSEPAWRASRDTPAQLELATPADIAIRRGVTVATDGAPDLHPASISATLPGPRGSCAMDHDPIRAQSLMFGGFWSIYAVGPVAGSDTWLFDGSAWSEVATPTTPPGRSQAALAHDATRDRHVMFGGTGSGLLGDTWEFDGSDWRRVCWPACAAGDCSCTRMPSPRQGATSFFDVRSGQVVLFGGADASGARSDSWTWNGSDWSPLSPAHSPPPSSGAQVASSPEQGLTMLFGGTGTWFWDGLDWSGSAALPPTGSGATDVWWEPSDGAFHAYFSPSNLLSTWDGAAWNFATAPVRTGGTGFSTYYSGGCSAFDRERRALVRFGGCVDGTCRIDYSSNQLTALFTASLVRQLAPATAPGARTQGSMADVPDDGVAWLAGGRSANRYAYQDNWTWDGASWASDGGGAGQNGLFGTELAWIGTGHLARFGGDTTGGGTFPGSAAISTWVRTSPGWTFNTWGGNFFQPGAYPEPSVQSDRAATTDQAFAYDEVAGQALYFRGEGAGTFSGQWVTNYQPWVMLGDANGLLWTALTPAASPNTVAGHRLAWCQGAGGLVLVGGVDGAGALSDRTWTWDWVNGTWTELLPAQRPPARTQPVLFCDRPRAKLYLVGGQGAAGDLDDVWEFDGASWTERTPAQRPKPRHGASGAFLSSQGRGVIFGGQDVNGYRGDTWTWDGGRDGRPAQVFHARFGAAGADPLALQGVDVTWDAGARSVDASSVALSGAALHVWDRGIWRATGSANGAGPSAPAPLQWSTSTDPEWSTLGSALPARLRRLLSGPAEELAFAVAPLGTNRDHSPVARVATGYAEVKVHYRLSCLPTAAATRSAQRCCSGTAAGGRCQ